MPDLTTMSCGEGNSRRARRFGLLTLGAVLGAGAAYLFDAASGRRRRHEAKDRTLSVSRRGAKAGIQAMRRAGVTALGKARGRLHRMWREPQLDDVELAHKVSSEIFRDGSFPKGRLNVNAENGTVFVRGEVDSHDLIEAVTDAVRRVRGVRAVENLMHLPDTPAPHPTVGPLVR